MTDPGRPRPGDVPRPAVRIGDAERNAAADALQQHLTAGRLTLDEYADRAAVVNAARTQDEVDRVFGDLPSVPGAPGGLPAARSGTGSALAAAAGVPPVPTGRSRSTVSRNVLRGLIAGMPIIALLLFLTTGLWYAWLLIPLGYLVLGPILNGRDDDPQPELGPGGTDR